MRTKRYNQNMEITTAIAGVGTTFDATKKHELTADTFPPDSNFFGHLQGMVVRFSSMASSPTKIYVQISEDANGDNIIIPETVADIATGVTTATKGAIAIRVDLLVKLPQKNMFVFYRTDTGTVQIDKTQLSWFE